MNYAFTINDDDEGMLVMNGVVLVEGAQFNRFGNTIEYIITPPGGGDTHQWFHVG